MLNFYKKYEKLSLKIWPQNLKRLSSIFFSSAHDGVHEDNIINAALAFNKQFNIKHWVVHYDVSLKTIFEFQMTLKQFFTINLYNH